MIVRDKNNIIQLLFSWHGTILPKVIPELMILMLISGVATFLSYQHHIDVPQVPALGFTVFGIILSIFLGFRNNASYDRWWEGRKLWGALIATTRHIDRDSHILSTPRRERTLHHLICFTNVLRDRLRQQTADLEHYLERVALSTEAVNDLKDHINAPQYMLSLMQKELFEAYKAGELSDILYTQLNNHIIELGAVQAGCDRIAGTPLPYAYAVLLNRAVYSFCFLLPFSLGSVLGIWTPILVGLLAYMFLGLDKLGAELEEPFGKQDNDLPLDSIVRLIERELLTSLKQPLPPTIALDKHNLH
ncbi:bestrophin family protein [Acinetobacter rathckeae]|uniref:bestrophin family protein n=1 Tax=Acinetobacter rathckeae TaxID=2605272 RepID=UPI0018A30A5B|nr:bestrophin family protein [Acinetobacter rathckeae]MBF7689049.1 bestrophin family protein [Acinetobacter rathckeae]MBF7696569.1 bestrophin family protein [Acinetobacter rathckeae]